MSAIEAMFHKKTKTFTWEVDEPLYVSPSVDLQGETLPNIIDSNGYRFELDNGIAGHFHVYRCTKIPLANKAKRDGLPFAEILAKLGGE